ncbi:hypothetical protein CICLE_v10033953mg [Citrus x clementina]|uniref:HAT C-terminal dimerisation domain-containing protein n=1 Tax=Citrus clementina TaxID=85681 RepID=V4TN96_CITCL|nr:hypothetical protein CICLE_v10033953mg [Citrus x clementina]
MFSATCEVLINFVEDRVTYASRADADAAYEAITSFEFVFVLHFMKNIMAVTNLLSQALQCQSQDILNAMRLVSSTKNVISFCKAHNIDIPDMNARYITRQVSTTTIERFFLVMRIVKTRLRNKMNDDFLTDTLITYIERDIAKKISMESVIDDFRDMKERKVRF